MQWVTFKKQKWPLRDSFLFNFEVVARKDIQKLIWPSSSCDTTVSIA